MFFYYKIGRFYLSTYLKIPERLALSQSRRIFESLTSLLVTKEGYKDRSIKEMGLNAQ